MGLNVHWVAAKASEQESIRYFSEYCGFKTFHHNEDA